MVRTRADGSYDTVSKYDAQVGQKVTDTYAATGGLVTRSIQDAGGNMTQQTFSNNDLSSEYIIYSPEWEVCC